MSASTVATRAFAVIGAATVLVVGFDAVTYAANGNSLLLGRLNTASSATIVKNTNATGGAALDLRVSNPAAPPLVVNSTVKVPKLYAARAASADKATTVAAASVTRVSVTGSVLAASSATVTATCPTGTVVTGGGHYSKHGEETPLRYSGPTPSVGTATAWAVTVLNENLSLTRDFTAYAMCLRVG